MLIEDFMLIMEMNAELFPEYHAMPVDQKRYLANINIITGTAQSIFEDGKLFAVGGIRYVGIGEAWMITPPEVRESKNLSLLRRSRQTFISDRDDHNLWRVFADNSISDNFLKHLQFVPNPQGHVWTRT